MRFADRLRAAAQLLPLGRRQTVLAATLVEVRLGHQFAIDCAVGSGVRPERTNSTLPATIYLCCSGIPLDAPTLAPAALTPAGALAV